MDGASIPQNIQLSVGPLLFKIAKDAKINWIHSKCKSTWLCFWPSILNYEIFAKEKTVKLTSIAMEFSSEWPGGGTGFEFGFLFSQIVNF